MRRDADRRAQSSFGFGQVGGTCVIVNPRYLLGALEPSAYESYKAKNLRRARLAYKAMSEMMISNSLVRVKDGPPFTKENEASVMLNPLARTSYDPKTGSYSFAKLGTAPAIDASNVKAVAESLAQSSATAGVGVDQGTFFSVNGWTPS